jgi:hypothetical protein
MRLVPICLFPTHAELRIRINTLSKWIREEAERHNAIADSTKLEIPYLSGNDKHNFEIASITPEEINNIEQARRSHLIQETTPLLSRSPITLDPWNHLTQHNEKDYMDQVIPSVFADPNLTAAPIRF